VLVDGGVARGGDTRGGDIRSRRWAVWRSPTGTPRWSRPVLLGVAAIAALSYAWNTSTQQPEIYYAAAVRSMASSWHNFFFGAFDPLGTISLDKLPGAFWLQALSVRLFGLHLWALNLPQIIEGTVTVLVLYRVVRRISGVMAATVAVLVYAATPAAVALNRGNISDTLLILLLVCSADATLAAIQTGRYRPLLVAAIWVGLAFQAKMLQAWLIVPALLLVWLVAGNRPLAKRVIAGLAMMGVTVVVSLSWMVIVTAVPHDDRPYVDGSNHDSLFEQVFDYNGFARADATGNDGGSGSGSLERVINAVTLDARSRVDRTVAGPGGRAIGWLLPAALGGIVIGFAANRGASRTDPERAATILWGGWLAIDITAFTISNSINAYYLAALAPPIAALVGIGFGRLGSVCTDGTVCTDGAVGRSSRYRATATVCAIAVVAYAAWLLAPAPDWLRIAVLGFGAALCLLAVRRPLMVPAVLAAVLLAPLSATVALVSEHGGPFTTPFEPAEQRAITQAGVAASISTAQVAMGAIAIGNPTERYPAAAYTSLLAAPLIYVTGTEVLPIGGFTGRIPSPTLAQLMTDVGQGELRTVIAVPTNDQRIEWVESHCQALPSTAGGEIKVFYCT
jgi:4-amino-4-deoxy-L-arabinose transferase-like glycosyltransferase